MDAANSIDDEEDVVRGGDQQHDVGPGVVVDDAGDGLGVVTMMQSDEEDDEGSSSNTSSSSSSSSIVLLGVKEGRDRRRRSTYPADASIAAAVQRQDDDEGEGEEQDLGSAHAGDEDGNGGVTLLDSTNTTGAAGTEDVMIGGRAINECWKYLSTKSGQHLVNETRCMKCGSMVRHHRKSEKVKAHLNRCRPFLNSLRGAGLIDADIPHWVVLRNDGRKKNIKIVRTSKDRLLLASPATISTSASNAYTSTATSATTAATRTPSTTTASTKPRANKTMHD